MRALRLLAPASAALLLTACGMLPGQETATTAPPATVADTPAATPSTSDEPDASPTDDGDRVTGQGYSYTIPDGWEDVTTQVKKEQPLADTAVMSTDAVDGFRDNVNVIPASNRQMSADQIERSLVNELSGSSDYEDVSGQDQVQIDGVEAAQVWSQIKGREFSTVQFGAYHQGKSYVITYSSGADHAEASQRAQEFLNTWSWE